VSKKNEEDITMSYEHIEDEEVISRKHYRCAWCAERILKGQKSWSRTYKWEGKMHYDHVHLRCWNEMCQKGEKEFVYEPSKLTWILTGIIVVAVIAAILELGVW